MKSYPSFLFLFLAIIAISDARYYSRRSCDNPFLPQHGSVTCEPSTQRRSFCTFTCDPGYKLIGNDHTACYHAFTTNRRRFKYYFWSNQEPDCKPSDCPVLEGIPNADIDCNGREPGDYCFHECFNNYQMFPSDRPYQDCLSEGRWTEAPCCVKKANCSGDRKADVVIALDSSYGFGAERWSKMKKFIRDFIDLFSVEEDMTRFSILRYDNDVDVRSKILLNDYINDRISFLEAYDEIPDNLNQGHYVSKALEYIASTVLKEENGDRPNVHDVILLITKERSDDAGRLDLPGFHADYAPKIFVVTVDHLDQFVPLQQILDPTEDIRDYWEDITYDKEAVYLAESSDLAGLGTTLQTDMKKFVCQIKACTASYE